MGAPVLSYLSSDCPIRIDDPQGFGITQLFSGLKPLDGKPVVAPGEWRVFHLPVFMTAE